MPCLFCGRKNNFRKNFRIYDSGIDDSSPIGMMKPSNDTQTTTKPEPETAMTNAKTISRDEAVQMIKASLKARTGRSWSVTTGRGTVWGWITVTVPNALRTWERQADGSYTNTAAKGCGDMGPEDRKILAAAMGLDDVHCQGLNIPSGSKFYQEYTDRAAGRTPTVLGDRDWD